MDKDKANKLVQDYLEFGDETAFNEIYRTYSKEAEGSIIRQAKAGNSSIEDIVQIFWTKMITGGLARWNPEKCSLRQHIKQNAKNTAKNYFRDDERKRIKQMPEGSRLTSMTAFEQNSDGEGKGDYATIDRGDWGIIDEGNYRAGSSDKPTPLLGQNHSDLVNDLIAEETYKEVIDIIADLRPQYHQPFFELVQDGYEHGALKEKAEEYGIPYSTFKSTWQRFEARVQESLSRHDAPPLAEVIETYSKEKRLSQDEMKERIHRRFVANDEAIRKRLIRQHYPDATLKEWRTLYTVQHEFLGEGV
jgi:RNA polymerase sigma factor (sigma-70 family)